MVDSSIHRVISNMHEINKRPEIMASEEKTAAVSDGHGHLGTVLLGVPVCSSIAVMATMTRSNLRRKGLC